MGKLNVKGIAINPASLGIIDNQFFFETGCFVLKLDAHVLFVMRVESLKL